MTPYKDWAPTGFDPRGAFLEGDRDEWLVAPVGYNRDSGPAAESNFEAFLKGLGGEGPHVERHRFGHWACGWFEIILVDPGNEDILAKAEGMEASLKNYPVLDEEDMSRREFEDYKENWDTWGRGDYVKALANRITSEFEDEGGISCRNYTAEEIAEDVSSICDGAIDEFASRAEGKVGWVYQHSDSECSINIDELAEETDIDGVVDAVDSILFARQQNAEIEKLCHYMGKGHLAKAAVAARAMTASAINALDKGNEVVA